jgi:hypothetical protein
MEYFFPVRDGKRLAAVVREVLERKDLPGFAAPESKVTSEDMARAAAAIHMAALDTA